MGPSPFTLAWDNDGSQGWVTARGRIFTLCVAQGIVLVHTWDDLAMWYVDCEAHAGTNLH